MAKTFSYADAVKLLGGDDNKIVAALDTVTAGLLSMAVPGTALIGGPAVSQVLSWFDARAEFVRLGHCVVRAFSERRGGLSRHSRTVRLEAAHSIIVVTAFFEEFAAAPLPFQFKDLDLTKDEQSRVALKGREVTKDEQRRAAIKRQGITQDEQRLGAGRSLTRPGVARTTELGLLRGVPLPLPQDSEEAMRTRLSGYYGELASALSDFLTGLAVVSDLSDTAQERIRETIAGLPERAVDRYCELARQLAVDFPEVAWWLGVREHQATRARLGDLETALNGVHELLAAISTGRAPDERRAELARAYRKALDRPIVESTDVPEGFHIPTLAEAYVQPLFRVAQVLPGTKASDEAWWSAQPVRTDLEEFLTAFLTSPQATVAPLMVLGQPGSGKSVLTKVLAARLPAADFMPVRVVLRDVPAEAELQDQIEDAIRAATGERLAWPALVRSAGDALPVVLLDGFDELLQATGVNQTDYLLRIARFQRREADQGRPLAVVVTSRTSVADRARPAEDTVALRLEPFDEERIADWVARWNRSNALHLEARGLDPLPTAAVLAHPELAGQPLLLLMLALYDADGNALRKMPAELGEGELYERLLRNFATREVSRHRPSLSDRELNRAIEEELRRLSVVAFAMFNRGSQWITEPALEADLSALPGVAPAAVRQDVARRQDLSGRLGPAEIVLGRFFFIHRSQARQDDSSLHTYEFLHATFGEFLVARFTVLVLRDIAARRLVPSFSVAADPVDDSLLHALLSFAPLSSRAPVLAFLTELLAKLRDEERETLRELLIDLFCGVHEPRSSLMFAQYQPSRLGVPARHAAYSANLALLAIWVTSELRGRDLFGPDADWVEAWHSQALLWRSQLSSQNWSSIVDALALEQFWDGEQRDIRLRPDDGTFSPPPIDPYWIYGEVPFNQREILSQPQEPAEASNADSEASSDESVVDYPFAFRSNTEHHPEVLRRKANLQCGRLDSVALHALEPLTEHLGWAVNTYRQGTERQWSVAHLLLDAWLLPLRQPSVVDRRRLYGDLIGAVIAISRWPDDGPASRGRPSRVNDRPASRLARLLLDRLATDDEAPPDVIVVALDNFAVLGLLREMQPAAARCVLVLLNRTDAGGTDRVVRNSLHVWTGHFKPSQASASPDQAERPVVELAVRIIEEKLDLVGLSFGLMRYIERAQEAGLWPDLFRRLARVSDGPPAAASEAVLNDVADDGPGEVTDV